WYNICTGFTGTAANARQPLLPEVIAVADIACCDLPHNAPNVAAVSADDSAGVVAIFDCGDKIIAVVVMPHDAANVAAAADGACDVTRVAAVLNSAGAVAIATIPSCDAACGTIGTDSAGVVAPR